MRSRPTTPPAWKARTGRRSLRSAWLGLLVCAACTATGAGSRTAARAPKPEPEKPSDLIGLVERYRTRAEDTLIDLAVEHDLGYVEIVSANPGVDPWVPRAGTELLLPKAHLLPSGAREGIVVNLPEQRLYFYPRKGKPLSFPIGVGREGWETPLGATKVVRKKKDPTWYPGPGARKDDPTLGAAVPPGEDNPLGTHAMYLGFNSYLIHGTNQPYGVGRRSSRGCIRLYPEDIVQLYSMVPVGTPVRLVSEQIKLGWFQGELYLEAHPSLDQATELEDRGEFTPAASPPEVESQIRKAAGPDAERINWPRVREALDRLLGIPTRITEGEPLAESAQAASAPGPGALVRRTRR